MVHMVHLVMRMNIEYHWCSSIGIPNMFNICALQFLDQRNSCDSINGHGKELLLLKRKECPPSMKTEAFSQYVFVSIRDTTVEC